MVVVCCADKLARIIDYFRFSWFLNKLEPLECTLVVTICSWEVRPALKYDVICMMSRLLYIRELRLRNHDHRLVLLAPSPSRPRVYLPLE